MNRLTPADLPTAASATFIAYATPVRVANPEGGDPLTVRPRSSSSTFPRSRSRT